MYNWLERLDKRWRSLPLGKQQRYILYFFTGYLLLTAGVIFKVWIDMSESDGKIVIDHIENPVLETKENPASLPDSVKSILNNNNYERK